MGDRLTIERPPIIFGVPNEGHFTMTRISQSVYEPGPMFMAANPLFVSKIMARVYFMQGLLHLMDEGESTVAAKREIVECIKEADQSIRLTLR